MLASPLSSAYLWTYANWSTNPAQNFGTSVTVGTSNSEGAWTSVGSSSDISEEVSWMFLRVANGFAIGTARNMLLDVGVDPAGGTAYTEVVSNWVCGSSDTTRAGHPVLLLPIQIQAGSSVAVRVQGSDSVAATLNVASKFWGKPSAPQAMPSGKYSQTMGTITNSNGTSFTPGNASDGAWVSMGTTTKDLWWWQVGVQIDNATMSSHFTYVDIAYGDATNKNIINRSITSSSTSENVIPLLSTNLMWMDCYRPIPSGTELWIRGRNSAAPVSGYNATIVGVGG